jgi:hypothetical protein
LIDLAELMAATSELLDTKASNLSSRANTPRGDSGRRCYVVRFSRAQKMRQRIALAAFNDRITSGMSQDGSVSTGPSRAVCAAVNPMYPKLAFASLDRVSLVPTADSWAVRQGPAVSVVLAGSAGFQVSAPSPASADRNVVGHGFLDLTFYFSFAGLYCW